MSFIGNDRFESKLLQVDVVLGGELVRHDENDAIFVEGLISFFEKLDVGGL